MCASRGRARGRRIARLCAPVYALRFARTEFARTGFARTGFARTKFARTGFARTEFARTGFARTEFARTGFARTGFARTGFARTEFARTGFARTEFARTGFARTGFARTEFVPVKARRSPYARYFSCPAAGRRTIGRFFGAAFSVGANAGIPDGIPDGTPAGSAAGAKADAAEESLLRIVAATGAGFSFGSSNVIALPSSSRWATTAKKSGRSSAISAAGAAQRSSKNRSFHGTTTNIANPSRSPFLPCASNSKAMRSRTLIVFLAEIRKLGCSR
ncbi:MAG: hypothetical protein EXS02_10685 [Planctomycetes bacterium]|nr:hypothetical protein [Planctomycetota bacterium]